MACVLGCPQDYYVYVAHKGGAPVLSQQPLQFKTLEWSRVLDDVSQCKVTIDLGKAPECCDVLSRTEVWLHELVIYRDEERVWEGPVVYRHVGRDQALITAMDVLAWLEKRVIHERLCYTAACGRTGTDLADIGAAIIRDALLEDDPNVLQYMLVDQTGVAGERDYLAESGKSLDALDELAKTSLDYTTIGRRVLLGGPLTFGRLTQLRCDHFSVEPAVIQDGLAAANVGYAQGDGVIGHAGAPDAYGLLEEWIKQDPIKDQTSADFAAANLIAGANPPPVFVAPASGSYLTPDTPICINQLVAGALVPVNVDCVCTPTEQLMRLVALQVRVDESGEKVVPLLEPVGAISLDPFRS